MKKVLSLFTTLMLGWSSFAQIGDFQYLGENYWADELYLGVAVRHVSLTAPNAPRPENHTLTGWTGDFLLYRSTRPELGNRRYVMRNKLLGEIFWGISNDASDINRKESSTFSHFLLGSHTWGWNAYTSDRLVIALGANIADLITGSTFVLSDSLGNDYRETPTPHGWYLGAGPSAFIDVLLTDFLLLELQYDYTFHFTNPVGLTYGLEEPEHSMPQQSFISVSLMSSLGLYTAVEYSVLNDRTPTNNDHYKFEWHFGFKYMF